MDYRIIYITAKSIKEARKIAQFLLENRLAACCNIIPQIESWYWWSKDYSKEPSTIQRTREAVVIAKTTKKKTQKLIAQVKKIHSDKVPSILSLPIKEGNKGFLKWIEKEVL